MSVVRDDLVVITGASRGLGLAIAGRLLTEGYRVCAVSRRLSGELSALADGSEGRLVHVEADLVDIGAIPGLARRITAEHGVVYGLVNNAGVGKDGLLATQHVTEILELITVNLTASILLTKHLVRSMLRSQRGSIVNITSIVARSGFAGLSVYGATKAGLEGFTRALAREVGRANVTVNAVAPGFIETAMTAGLTREQLGTIARRSPRGLVTASDVAGAVAYLLGADARQVTGSVITVDGGSTA